jgi:ppGpp synthetase/RelA/SpoT-type nucleotidyltranferase
MNRIDKEKIIISFLRKKDKYIKFAEFFLKLLREDPLFPKESIHTTIYRLKDEIRLIEKIEILNKKIENGIGQIDDNNYHEVVEDLLGVRIICLRLSDVENVEEYLKILSTEQILTFINPPEHKKSFILPVTPGNSMPVDINLSSTGYSSIHYQIKLGKNSDPPDAFKNLCLELQLRTILEEAWGEIDHKYRYIHSRIGGKIPEHVNEGFYHFSAYLQVAALQAEYLCRLTEADSPKKATRIKDIAHDDQGDDLSMSTKRSMDNIEKFSSSQIEEGLRKNIGINISAKTMIYIKKRLREVNADERLSISLWELLCNNRLNDFKKIFKESLNTEPFENAKYKDIDLINALNFAIFYELHGERIAGEGLINVLKWRKMRSMGNDFDNN